VAGYFDERFFLYFEDVDLCRRMGAISKIVYYPNVRIVHVHKKESSSSLRALLIHIVSALRYFIKWTIKSGS